MRKISLFILLCSVHGLFAQRWFEPADTFNTNRAWFLGGGEALTYGGSLAGLHFAWYSDYRNGKFHFFNDIDGWLQMDKFGHATTSYQITSNLYKLHRWTGMSSGKSLLWSVGLGYSYQTFVEIEDGFSQGWGWSWWDVGFNSLGSALFLSQQLTWKEQRLHLKYSFWPSGLTQLPDPEGRRARNLYGNSIFEQWLKDYNGQTYWLSANIWSLTGKPEHFPKWLNVAAGYSINNVLGAERNKWVFDGDDVVTYSNLVRQRQVLLSLDIDLEKANLPPKLFWLKSVFSLIKFPFPALEWNDHRGWVGHAIYF